MNVLYIRTSVQIIQLSLHFFYYEYLIEFVLQILTSFISLTVVVILRGWLAFNQNIELKQL